MWCWLGIGKDSSTFGPSDAPIFRNVALITVGIGGFCSLLFHIIVKIESRSENEEVTNTGISNIEGSNGDLHGDDRTVVPSQQNDVNNETSSLLPSPTTIAHQKMNIIDWLCEPQLYQVACLYTFSRLFVNISQAYMPLYLNVSLELPATYVAIIPMIMYISGIFTAIITKTVTKRLGIKFTCIAYCIVGGAGCMWIHWGKYNDIILDL